MLFSRILKPPTEAFLIWAFKIAQHRMTHEMYLGHYVGALQRVSSHSSLSHGSYISLFKILRGKSPVRLSRMKILLSSRRAAFHRSVLVLLPTTHSGTSVAQILDGNQKKLLPLTHELQNRAEMLNQPVFGNSVSCLNIKATPRARKAVSKQEWKLPGIEQE